MINDAGGISVLAHPWCCKNLSELLPALVAAGLQVFNNSLCDIYVIDLFN